MARSIKPGDVENSLLIKAVRRADKELQMPPKHALEAEEIAALEQWVRTGRA
ncbi:MAG: c-type cytochrome domain-containing protein [Burkholderiaceae bacterium]